MAKIRGASGYENSPKSTDGEPTPESSQPRLSSALETGLGEMAYGGDSGVSPRTSMALNPTMQN